MKGYFVAGTDTGVGKTEISRALLMLCKGFRALKPIETGDGGDAAALAALSGQSLEEVCPYRFKLPAAPLVAAEAENATIDLERIVASVRAPIIVEAAGGLLVPITREVARETLEADEPDRAPATTLVTNLDLAVRLDLPVILVGRAGLGTLNHCALSAEAVARRGLQLAAIVLNRVTAEDDPTVATNPAMVAELTGARVLGPTPFVADAAARPDAIMRLLSVLDQAPESR